MTEGLCQCGCGNPTRIAPYSCKRDGWIKGKPIRFIKGHYFRLTPSGAENHNWKGGRRYNPSCGVMIMRPDHPRRSVNGYVLEHVLIVERALGHPLPANAVIHHVNRNNADNRNSNLVICQDSSYHKLIHLRMIALKACGHSDWRRCAYCKRWDSPDNLVTISCGRSYHGHCVNENNIKRYHQKHPLSSYRPHKKLTKDQVIEIRKLCNRGIPAYKIADQFGVSKSNVQQIKQNRIWKHF